MRCVLRAASVSERVSRHRSLTLAALTLRGPSLPPGVGARGDPHLVGPGRIAVPRAGDDVQVQLAFARRGGFVVVADDKWRAILADPAHQGAGAGVLSAEAAAAGAAAHALAARSADVAAVEAAAPAALGPQVHGAGGGDLELGAALVLKAGVHPGVGGAAVLGDVHDHYGFHRGVDPADPPQLAQVQAQLADGVVLGLDLRRGDAAGHGELGGDHDVVVAQPQLVGGVLGPDFLQGGGRPLGDLGRVRLGGAVDLRVGVRAPVDQALQRRLADAVVAVAQLVDGLGDLGVQAVGQVDAEVDADDVLDRHGQGAIVGLDLDLLLDDQHADGAAVHEAHFGADGFGVLLGGVGLLGVGDGGEEQAGDCEAGHGAGHSSLRRRG